MGTIALIAQLVLAVAVGIAVVAGLVTTPSVWSPWALAYLAWCITILGQLIDRARNT